MTRPSTMKLLMIGAGLVAIVGVILVYSSGRSASQGRIVFEMAPNQQGSPLTIMSIALSPASLREPAIVLRNNGNQAVQTVSAVALIRTPTSMGTRAARELAITIAPGAQATAVANFPDLWRSDPWREFPDGAVIVFGLEAASFVGGSQWRSLRAPGGPFTLPDDVRLGPPVVIGRLPMWHMVLGRSVMFANTVSQFPISGSIDGDQCIMHACPPASAACEYNGCTIR